MRLHYLQHVPFEGLGSIADWAMARGHSVSGTRMHADDRLPALDELDLLVIMGGPMNVYEDDRYKWMSREKKFIEQAVRRRKPVLGICLGAQLIASVLGARINQNDQREIGWFDIHKSPEAGRSALADFLPQKAEVFHWHGDTFAMPQEAVHLARSAGCTNQGFIAQDRMVGLQFHLEMTRAAAAALIQNNRGDFEPPGAFIQDPEHILAEDGRFERSNALLIPLLEQLAAVAGLRAV